MPPPTDLEFLVRVLLATGCGALIGLERQYRSRTAGLRTQALVAAGAASFVLFGEQVGGTDAPVRIAAYVVSGVGFLGGGVILRQGFSVQGLNTAATLWCSAAIGCQAAAGHMIPALTLTAIVLAIHTVLRPFGRLLDRTVATKDESVAPALRWPGAVSSSGQADRPSGRRFITLPRRGWRCAPTATRRARPRSWSRSTAIPPSILH